MMKVSHREFTKIKNSFNPATLYFYILNSSVNCTPDDDDWIYLKWRFRGELDELFGIVKYHDGRPAEYYVSDEAYKMLRIFKLCGMEYNAVSKDSDIS